MMAMHFVATTPLSNRTIAVAQGTNGAWDLLSKLNVRIPRALEFLNDQYWRWPRPHGQPGMGRK